MRPKSLRWDRAYGAVAENQIVKMNLMGFLSLVLFLGN